MINTRAPDGANNIFRSAKISKTTSDFLPLSSANFFLILIFVPLNSNYKSIKSMSVILFREIFRLFGENVVSRDSCEKSDFHCSTGECLDFGKLCDGAPDCRDHSDEDVDRWVLQKSRALNSILKTCKLVNL